MKLQATKKLDVLEQVIEKSGQNIRKQIEKCQEMLANLGWLKEQCDVYRRAKAEEGFVIRTIPERKVLYMSASQDIDIWDLVMLHQTKLRKELQQQKTIQRCYGYILKENFWQQGELKFEGEYIRLGSYSQNARKELKTLPAGKYLCLRKTYADWSKPELYAMVEEIIKVLKIDPKLMILEEISLYLLSWEDTIYELQIHIPE